MDDAQDFYLIFIYTVINHMLPEHAPKQRKIACFERLTKQRVFTQRTN